MIRRRAASRWCFANNEAPWHGVDLGGSAQDRERVSVPSLGRHVASRVRPGKTRSRSTTTMTGTRVDVLGLVRME